MILQPSNNLPYINRLFTDTPINAELNSVGQRAGSQAICSLKRKKSYCKHHTAVYKPASLLKSRASELRYVISCDVLLYLQHRFHTPKRGCNTFEEARLFKRYLAILQNSDA
jgi:hypothetical protein